MLIEFFWISVYVASNLEENVKTFAYKNYRNYTKSSYFPFSYVFKENSLICLYDAQNLKICFTK